MKILVIEDDSAVAQTLKLLFAGCNYAVDMAPDGESGLQLADAFDYDLVLLDLILPRLDGIGVCQQLRAKGFQSPILLLTGQGAGRQKAIALNAGADDYVVKPFDTEELIARVQALLRRGGPTNQPILSWGPLSIDPSNCKVAFGTRLLVVTPKEYAILELLLRSPQRALSARTILDRVWASLESPGEEAVRVHIKELRQKLAAIGAPKDFIKTQHRVGYQLNPLYASASVLPTANQLTVPHFAELNAVNEELRVTNEELRVTLEQLQATQAELSQKNEELEIAYQTIEQERQRLQASRDELELRVAERTAELITTNQFLKRQRDQWQALFDHALDAIAITDDNGHYVDANPAACELFGVSREDLIGASIVDFADPEVDIAMLWQQFLQQGQMSGAFRLRRPDGTIRAADFNAIAHFTPGRHLSILRDITERVRLDAERKQVEIALHESEEKFRRFAETSHGVIWLAHPGSLENLYVSPAYELIWGRSRQSLIERPDSWLEAIHPDDRERVRTQLEQQRDEKTSNAEYRIVRPDGSIRWIWDWGFAISNDAGQVYLYGGIAEDVTDRKQAEIELRQREEFLRSIYDGADQGIFVIEVSETNDFHYSHFNRIAEQFAGASTQALQGKTPEVAFGGAIGGTFRQNYERCLKVGTSICYEEHIVFADHTIWTLTTLAPLRNEQGRIYRIVGTAIDITARKHLELSLQASEAKLSRILDSAIASIASFRISDKRDWQYEYWSAGCEPLFGYSIQELMDDQWLWLSRVVPADRETILMPLFEDFFAERQVTVEYRFLHQNGTVRWISSAYATRQINNDCWIVTAVNYDISDRKRTELVLQQQIRQEYILTDIAQDIRRSLNLGNVLSRTVHRVRDFLRTDRVIIFRFRPNWHGDVITESVGAEWLTIRSTTIYDPCFSDRYIAPYRQGRIATLSDIDQPDLEPCYVELLQQFQVKANLVVPILQGENLWGLLIAHECRGPREWQPAEIALLRRLATQVGIAIQQSELYEQTRRELLERERMQTVLEESEERFRSLSAAAPVGICQTNADGICLYTNTRWQEMSGLSFEDSLGDGWLRAIHPEDRAGIMTAWDAYLQGGSERLPEFRLLTPKGEIRWVSARVATIKSATGEVLGYVGIDEDITERKLTEQKIREQAALLDIASDAIFVRDLDHRILYWNRGAERLYGWNTTEALGQNASQLLQNPNFSLDAIMQQLLTQGEWQGELHNKTKAGKQITVEARWTLVRDELGQPQHILAVNTDVTDKKQLEAQFYRAQRLESLGTLASGIAHDLNNVLTPILAIAQLLRLREPHLDVRSQEMLNVLEESAKRGANMIKQVLTFTRGTDGERSLVEIGSLLQEIINIIQQTFPKSIAIRQTMPDQSRWLVSADPTYLHQVLMNLCVNARDAMPNGGTLTFSVEHCAVDQALAQANLGAQVGDHVVVTIADTGTGIPLEMRDRIFDPFFTTKPLGQGTGLGLATVLGIVKNYGGFLQVLSEVGQGTQFKVYLPTIAGIASSLSQPEVTFSGYGEMVLLVDDDVAVQCSTQSLLENHQYTVLSTNDGLEAIALYLQHRDEIRAVILDIMMPNMSGITLIQRLKEINPDVKTMAISGLPANREPALAMGASAFLPKPYTLADLLQSLHKLIEDGA